MNTTTVQIVNCHVARDAAHPVCTRRSVLRALPGATGEVALLCDVDAVAVSANPPPFCALNIRVLTTSNNDGK